MIMLHKDEFLSTHPGIHTGMDAYSVDGEKLGEVERLDEDSVTIEKGWFFPRDFTVRYDDIVDIREDHLVVSRSRADLEGWRDEGYSGWEEYDRANAEPRAAEQDVSGEVRKEDVKVERNEPKGRNR